MSTPPASARISAFLPVMSQPTNQGPRIRFESGVGSLDATREDIFEVEVSCFLTNPSLTPHLDDFALVSGSLRCDSTGDRVIGHIDVSNLNIIVPAPDADSVDPTHPSTATLDLIGRVTAVNGRSFTLETGAYSHEVCLSLHLSLWNLSLTIECSHLDPLYSALDGNMPYPGYQTLGAYQPTRRGFFHLNPRSMAIQ